MVDDRLIEGIDACRPGSLDLDLPELADVAARVRSDAAASELYGRAQKLDAVLCIAVQDVAVPAGLDDRLLARLRADVAVAPLVAGASLAAEHVPAASDDLPGVAPAVSGAARSTRRRWLLFAAIGGVAACLLLAPLVVSWLKPDPIAAVQVPSLADTWYRKLAGWRPLADAPSAFPLPRGILAAAQSWQPLNAQRGERGVAYDLSAPGLGRAVVFVVNLAVNGLPPIPPAKPVSTTGGQAILAWQSGGQLVVLVVQLDGDPQRYRRFINSAGPPVA